MTDMAARPAQTSYHDRARFARARRQVDAIKGFYVHFAVFVAVLVLLFIVNYAAGPPWWVQWVFFGWGVGVVGHAIGVYGRAPRMLADWERRKLRQLMAER